MLSFLSSSEPIRLSKESAKLSATANFIVVVLLILFFYAVVAAEVKPLFLILLLKSIPWCGDPKSLSVSIYISTAFGLSISDLGLNSRPLYLLIASLSY